MRVKSMKLPTQRASKKKKGYRGRKEALEQPTLEERRLKGEMITILSSSGNMMLMLTSFF